MEAKEHDTMRGSLGTKQTNKGFYARIAAEVEESIPPPYPPRPVGHRSLAIPPPLPHPACAFKLTVLRSIHLLSLSSTSLSCRRRKKTSAISLSQQGQRFNELHTLLLHRFHDISSFSCSSLMRFARAHRLLQELCVPSAPPSHPLVLTPDDHYGIFHTCSPTLST
jgi:hypothetical protein